jgi:hypothetical protein
VSRAVIAIPRLFDIRKRDGFRCDLQAGEHGSVEERSNCIDETLLQDAADAAPHELDRRRTQPRAGQCDVRSADRADLDETDRGSFRIRTICVVEYPITYGWIANPFIKEAHAFRKVKATYTG